ncbi:hypothetical protein [Nostoc sp.]|uniref:hypothetical protein n=1 Tax=Nostoc sp. TaxID=1180 RepID=UPI002FFA29A2
MSPRGCAFAPASSIAKQAIAAYSPFKVVRTTAEAISALLSTPVLLKEGNWKLAHRLKKFPDFVAALEAAASQS